MINNIIRSELIREDKDVYRHNMQILSSIRRTQNPVVRYPDIVRFDHVTKSFGDKVVLNNINFYIENIPGTGEFISVVGPSGCGKSSLIRCLAGLEPHFPPTEGKVYVGGKEVTKASAKVGLVDQSYSLLPNLTVLQNIAFGLMLQGVDRQTRMAMAEQWCNKVGLSGKEDEYPDSLSGGQRQRVAIAATLIMKPRVILMDEPFGALDVKVRHEMQNLLFELCSEYENTVFLVTHQMDEAVVLSDRIFRMDNGEIVEVIHIPKPNESLELRRKHKWFHRTVWELEQKLLEANTI